MSTCCLFTKMSQHRELVYMDNLKNLSNWRLEKAQRCLRSAQTLFNDEDYSSSANRSYYCVFHCMRSVLALQGVDFKKHSAVIAYFRENYIKTGIFEKNLSDILSKLFTIRTESDYDDFYLIDKQEIIVQLENAKYFYDKIKDYLDNN